MLAWFWRRFPNAMISRSLLSPGLRDDPDRSGDHTVAQDEHALPLAEGDSARQRRADRPSAGPEERP